MDLYDKRILKGEDDINYNTYVNMNYHHPWRQRLTLQCGMTGTARHGENITCRGMMTTTRHAAHFHSFVYISTT